MPRNMNGCVQGPLDFLILRALSWGEMHGYAVGRWILDASGEELQIEEGILYPALHRLEDRGRVESSWRLNKNERGAKYYRLTALGREELAGGVESWDEFTAVVDKVLKNAPQRAYYREAGSN